jgi:hypothetical protein
MKRRLLILLVIPAYLMLSSKSCDSDREHNAGMYKAKTEKTKESIREEFETNYLTDQTLRAYELKAEQKLVDFADYLSIYYNKKLEEPLRELARLGISGLFVSEGAMIQSFFPANENKKELTLAGFLSHDYFPAYNSVKILIDSIRIETPLQRSGNTLFTGKISFFRRLEASSPSDTLIFPGKRMNVEIMAKKVNKSFGSDTLQVWGVFLGSIR